MLKLPKIIGHRGVAAYAPENTLEGIHTAADMGVEWVELDVKITKDGVPILFHDDTLERVTGASGNVADKTWEDLRQLEAGSWFSDGFAGISIPTLEEAIDVLMEHDLGVNIELKPCPGREVDTAEAALDILSRAWDAHDKILISSFSHVSLETAADMAQDWACGLILPTEWPENWAELIAYLDVATININGNTCSQEQVHSLLPLGKRILAYTINDPDRASLLQSWGVDGFFSDEPDVIREELTLDH